MKFRSASVLALALCASSASAEQLIVTVPFGPVPIGGSATVSVPRFDGAQNALRVAYVGVQGLVSGTWALENTTAQSHVLGGYGSQQWIGAYVPVSLPVGGMLPLNPAYPGEITTFSAYDGTTDFGGTSGESLPFTNQAGDGGPYMEYPAYTDAALAYYGAGGTFDVADRCRASGLRCLPASSTGRA